MSEYFNKICDCCGQRFTSDDDIAVCPDCGTPIHRKCWNGHCPNEKKHAEGFDWDKQKPEKVIVNSMKRCSNCGASLPNSADFCMKCGMRLTGGNSSGNNGIPRNTPIIINYPAPKKEKNWPIIIVVAAVSVTVLICMMLPVLFPGAGNNSSSGNISSSTIASSTTVSTTASSENNVEEIDNYIDENFEWVTKPVIYHDGKDGLWGLGLLEGTIKNISDKTQRFVVIEFDLYDLSGKKVDNVNYTVAFEIRPGEERTFRITPLRSDAERAELVSIY